MAGPLLGVTDLEVAYGRVEAVRGVSLEVAKGEFVAVIGSNGAGKSSTMKAIAGVIKPRGGSIRLAGADVTGEPAHAMVRRGLAMVPEGRQVFADQTVEDNLLLGGYARSQESAAKTARLERAYQLFPRLGERRTQQAGSLSGGEQQMLAIARGLQSEPELLVIDELSLGLAPRSSTCSSRSWSTSTRRAWPSSWSSSSQGKPWPSRAVPMCSRTATSSPAARPPSSPGTRG